MPASPAPITLVAATSDNNGAGAGTLVLTTPGGIVANQFLLATMAVAGGSGTSITPPAGWTLLRRTDQSTDVSIATYTRTVTGTEAATYTWTLGAAVQACGGMAAYNNVAVASPVNVENGNSITPINVTQTTASVVTTTAGTEVIAIWAINSNATLTTAFGTTEFNSASNTDNRIILADAIQAVAGATGAKTATAGAAAFGANEILALAPLQIYSETMTGGGVCGGTGVVNSSVSLSMSGGAITGGAADLTSTFNVAMTGGALAGGEATVGLVKIYSAASTENNTRIKFFRVIKYGDIDPEAVIAHGLGQFITRINQRTVTSTSGGGSVIIDGGVTDFETQYGVEIGDRVTNENTGLSGTVAAISGNELTVTGPTFSAGDLYSVVGDAFVPSVMYFKPIDAPPTLDGDPTYSQTAERFKYYLQQPTIVSVDATNIVMEFSTQVGSGSPVAQWELIVETPHLTTD